MGAWGPPRTPTTGGLLGAAAATDEGRQAAGKYYLGITPSPGNDRAAARYGFATMLLAGGGKVQFALHNDYTNERWFEEIRLRDRHERRRGDQGPSGVHRRAFTNGLVLVNPTTSAVQVDLGGAYTGSGLTNATGAILPPRSGLILAKAGGGAPFITPRPARADRKMKDRHQGDGGEKKSLSSRARPITQSPRSPVAKPARRPPQSPTDRLRPPPAAPPAPAPPRPRPP